MVATSPSDELPQQMRYHEISRRLHRGAFLSVHQAVQRPAHLLRWTPFLDVDRAGVVRDLLVVLVDEYYLLRRFPEAVSVATEQGNFASGLPSIMVGGGPPLGDAESRLSSSQSSARVPRVYLPDTAAIPSRLLRCFCLSKLSTPLPTSRSCQSPHNTVPTRGWVHFRSGSAEKDRGFSGGYRSAARGKTGTKPPPPFQQKPGTRRRAQSCCASVSSPVAGQAPAASYQSAA